MFEKYSIEKKDLLVPASILIGSILISISIFFSTGSLSFSKSKTLAVGDGQAPIGNREVVKITERKGEGTIGSGKVEIIEFSDFQCPFCQQFFNNAYKQIKTKYIDTGKVKFSFRHYPLPNHQNAQKAAEASECANKQGQFWPYHDVLFTKGKADGTGLAVADLKQYAKSLGLNITSFDSCLDNGEMAEIVKKDAIEGQRAGISGTPTIFINGKKVVGALPFASFETEIEAALKK